MTVFLGVCHSANSFFWGGGMEVEWECRYIVRAGGGWLYSYLGAFLQKANYNVGIFALCLK